IFCDYTNHGLTLKNYEIMMRAERGLPDGKTFFRRINKDVEDLGIEVSFSQDKFINDLKNHILRAF
ncbi:MAG: hypothetical protein K2I71_04000, partial [Helicobacter sp.]|nr:hypothetical protein [Helicobacter sp.]